MKLLKHLFNAPRGKFRPYIDAQNINKVKKYVYLKIKRRKHNTRPCELKYGYIGKSKKIGLTYKQVRRIMDILTKEGYLVKYKKFEKNNTRNFYLLKSDNTQRP